MRIKYSCGCKVNASPDGYGGIDATCLELCSEHFKEYRKKNK